MNELVNRMVHLNAEEQQKNETFALFNFIFNMYDKK